MVKDLKIIAIIVIIALPSVSFGNTIKISDIENYLNSITSIKSDFIQISESGHVETGRFFLKKPSRMRFEYNPPARHIVMASGPLLVIIDKKSMSEPQRYLTAMTPLSRLTQETISLKDSNMVSTTFARNDNFHIIIQNSNEKMADQLELVFNVNPIYLSEWTLTNFSNEKIRVLLENFKTNVEIDDQVFDIGNEIASNRKKLKNK